jgi:predicted ribosomally synthesized peptide with SipW-like signal peptide
MKKIILSVAMIAAVAAVAIGATTAYFSDVETSTGNTFTAGAIDLKVDSQCSYNGQQSEECGSWALADLNTLNSSKFFNFSDVKPGDSGENTISLHVTSNNAYACAYIKNLSNNDNGINEPESAVDSNDGPGNGELQNKILFTVWRDTGVQGTDGVVGKCDNVQQEGEELVVSNQPASNLAWPIANPSTGPLKTDDTYCLGVAWTLPAATDNEVQTDSMSADIEFYVEQSRNNLNFVCPTPVIAPTGQPV